MLKNLSKVTKWILMTIVGVILFCILINIFTKKITSYPLFCDEPIVNFEPCSSVKFAANRTTYKVDTKRQDVISWMPGFSVEIEKYTDCAVLGREDWTCTYDDKSGEFGFIEGKYFTKNLRYPSDDKNLFSYTSPFKWWLYHIGIVK